MNKNSYVRIGFTIIELLVVVSIITILVSILFPALYKAKFQGQSIVCTGNLKQIGLTSMIYTDYNNSWLLPGKVSGSYWYLLISEASTSDSNLKMPKNFTCPSEKTPHGLASAGYYQYTHYGSNTFLTGRYSWTTGELESTNEHAHKLSQIKIPNLALTTIDSWRKSNYAVNYIAFTGFRHSGTKANALYVDGHVNGVKFTGAVEGMFRTGFDFPGYE
ncbi:MAG: hypothetical protein A2017_19085 [Lentisphaerae bacterium GWF2_44_16]|nr:MAG: hypothetical protein A2017_19085 [Lentisphaerae bacterium GWF2_44_16]